MNDPKQQKSDERQPTMDEVLKRMLSSPPKQHKDERVTPKPAKKAAQKKAAK